MIDWSGIEQKWSAKWHDSKEFEVEPDAREKKFITVAYPYPNSPQHIGHGRMDTRPTRKPCVKRISLTLLIIKWFFFTRFFYSNKKCY